MALRMVLVVAVLLAAPSAARAVTIADIIALSKAGVSADILLAVIDADRTMFTLSAEDILKLKDAAVPDAVVVKMLGTQQEYAIDAPPPPLIVGNTPPPPAVTVTPIYFATPFFVVPGIPVITPVVPATQPRGFGRFINDGWIEGRGFGRFINTP